MRRITKPVLFGGLLPKPHFGHVLLEMFSRLWAHDAGCADPEMPILYFVHRQRGLEPFEHALLAAAFDSPRPQLIRVDHPMLLTDVLVPRQAVVLGQPMLPVVLPIYDRIRDALAGRDRAYSQPVFLSRARLADTKRRTLGENALDDRIRRRGILVVHPETLPLSEQVRVSASAATVIGLPGSALHLTIFREVDEARTISLGTRTPFAAQRYVEQVREADFVHLRALYPVHPRVPGQRAIELGPYRNFLIPAEVERRLADIL